MPVWGEFEPRASLGGEPRLLRTLGSLETADLAADRPQQALTLGQLALDGGLLGRTLGHEPSLLDVRVLQASAPRANGDAERLHLSKHLGALVGDASRGIEPLDQIFDARRADQHLEPGAVAPRRVELDEPELESGLRATQVALRQLELPAILLEIALDLSRASRSRGCTPRWHATGSRRAPGSDSGRTVPPRASRPRSPVRHAQRGLRRKPKRARRGVRAPDVFARPGDACCRPALQAHRRGTGTSRAQHPNRGLRTTANRIQRPKTEQILLRRPCYKVWPRLWYVSAAWESATSP